MNAHLNPEVRHDFVLLFDVSDGNPNGDPDAGNLPRVDPETGEGLVTDVALKRRVRDFVDVLKGTEERYKIYIQQQAILNERHQRAYKALNLELKGTKQPPDDVKKARQWMCENFYDIRTFGAVMSTEVNCGQVRGPLQLTFARSIDPILGLDIAITRVALTKPGEAQEESDEEGIARSGTMGRKAFVPYGLYRSRGFYVPSFAEDTGFDCEDLGLFWQALQQMWDLNRSASRGLAACRGIYVFSHSSKLGNAPAHKLFERIRVAKKKGVDAPRQFSDYTISVDQDGLPEGVKLTELVTG